jgi:hypothetical protein
MISIKYTGFPFVTFFTTNPDILDIYVDSKYDLKDVHNNSSKKIKIKCDNGS